MAPAVVKGVKSRKSIHEKSPAPNSKNLSYHDSQDEIESDCSVNYTQDLEESLTDDTSRTEKWRERSIPEIKHHSRSFNNRSYKSELESAAFTDKQSKSGSSTSFLNITIAIFCIAIIGYWFAKPYSQTFDQSFVCSFSKLQKKYPQEDEKLWRYLKKGHEHILNNESDQPAVYLFLHKNKEIGTRIVNDIAQTSSRCFGSEPIIRNIDFKSKEAIADYGHVIGKYKETIKEGNVILIANLNEIPAEAARALHSICDTHTPIVKKVIILLTLNVAQGKKEEKPIYTAINALRQLWDNKIEPFELDPIITRVTDQVLPIKSN